MTGDEQFPAAVYKDTVLAPLFEGSKRHFFADLMRINYAHGVMLAETAVCETADMTAILGALRDIEATLDVDAMVYTGAVEDLFFHVEGELNSRLGVDRAGRLHTGRSRNDMDHTVFKMGLKRRLAALLDTLGGLTDTMVGVAERNCETIIVAYTHGQPAQPSTFAHYLGAMIEVLLRDMERLLQAASVVDRCSMGAAAITTTGFAIDRARLADLLGFTTVQENAYGCIAACDYITSVYAALKILFINLGRFVQDLNQWSSFETGHLRVPDAYVQVSSIMPQKRNPVALEHLRLIASTGAGHCDLVINTMHNTPFTDMNDSEGEVQIAGYAGFTAARRVLTLLGGLIGAVSIDEGQVRRHIDASCITVTELADSLVRVEGISFRQAHDIASRLSRRVIADEGTLATVAIATFEAAFRAVMDRAPTLSEADFRRYVSPEHFIAVRTRYGGPAPETMAQSLAGYRATLTEQRTAAKTIAQTMAAADERLAAAVDQVMGS